MKFTSVIFVVLIILIAVLLVMSLRSRKIKEKYVILWLFLDILAFILLMLPVKLVDKISACLGFVYGSNMVFTVVIAVIIITAIQQSITISQLEENQRVYVEQIAILNNRISNLERKIEENIVDAEK